MFEPRKRTALDGKVWWCVFNTNTKTYSSLLFFGQYKRKKDCQYAIDRVKEKYDLDKLTETLKPYGIK